MAEKERKRKRSAEAVDRPNKKAATATATASAAAASSIRVSFATAKDELHPVIAAAPGTNFPSVSFTAYSKAANGSSATTPTPSTHSLLLQSSSHPKLDYFAGSDPNTHLDHYIGLFDPASSSLHIIPAHSATLRSNLRSEAAEVHARNAARSFAKQREELGMEFGTKKAKKAIASRTVNAITKETGRGVEAAVLDSVKEASEALPAKEDVQGSVLASKPIPRPSLAATQVEDVYPLSVLVPPAAMRDLAVKEWQDAVEARDNVKLSSRFVANRLQNVGQRDDVQALKALKYLLLLLDFNGVLRLAGRSGGKKVPPKDEMRLRMTAWPESLVDGVRKRFSDSNELNKWHMDNLMTHMAAISLYIDNWRTDTHDLREDLRMENTQMSQYFHELGCKVAPPTEKERAEMNLPNKALAAQRRIAKLKLPLDFPKVRNPPRRR